MPNSRSIFSSIAAACLAIAVVAGVWHGREGRIIIAGSDARFSFLNDMTWDVATRRLERTGSDPYGWIDLRASALPVRRVAMEFTGVIDQGVGSFSFFQSITNPTYVGLNSVDGTVTVQPGVVRVEAELNDSLCLRIDLPDFLLRPLELRRIVIERPFFNPGSWKFLTMVGAGLGAFGALAAMAVHTQVRRLGVGRVAFLIFVFSAVLRIGLTAANREAGDDHMKVCRILLDECRLPRTSDDWEGFQPKLYHATVAAIGYLLPPCRSTTGLLLTGQLLSCLAGLAFLGLVYRFLWQLPVSDRTRLWCFAFTAFNSKLISIHAQATNDSFVILFGALAIYAATRYLRTGTWRDWGWLIGALCLMALSKASGLVLVAVLPGVIALDLIWRIKLLAIDNVRVAATRMVGRLVVLGFFFAILVPIPGQYFQRYKESGTPFTTNVAVQSMPHWSERTYDLSSPQPPGISDDHQSLGLEFGSGIISGRPESRSCPTQLLSVAHGFILDAALRWILFCPFRALAADLAVDESRDHGPRTPAAGGRPAALRDLADRPVASTRRKERRLSFRAADLARRTLFVRGLCNRLPALRGILCGARS